MKEEGPKEYLLQDLNKKGQPLQNSQNVQNSTLPQQQQKEKESFFQVIKIVFKESFFGLCSFEMQLLTLTLINVYHIGHSKDPSLLVAYGIGDVFMKMFGYAVIKYLHMGLLSQCSQAYGYNKNQKLIGIYYQRGMLISGLVCIALAPLFYLSDFMLAAFGIQQDIAESAGKLAWVSMPSLFLFTYYDATKQLLYSQNYFGPPMLIQAFQVVFQFFISGYLINDLDYGMIGAAWGKNLGDAFASLLIYLYCSYKKKIENSWIEWNQCAFNRITSYVKYVTLMGLAGYIQEFCFYVITMIASSFTLKLEQEIQVIMYNCQQWHYNCFLGIHIVMINLLASSLMSGNYKRAKFKILSGVLLTFIILTGMLSGIYIYKEKLISDYTDIKEIDDTVFNSIIIYCCILFFDSIQLIYCGILKGVDMQIKVIWVYLFSYGIIGVPLGVVLVFVYGYGILGLYIGWLSGGVLSSICFWFIYVYRLKWLKQFQNIQKRMLKEKYAIKKEQEILKTNYSLI